jgi:hypothetical protein
MTLMFGQVTSLYCSFSSTWKKTNQKKTPLSRPTLRVAKPGDDAVPRAAMQRCPALREFSSAFACFGESQACPGALNLAIAARLATLGALPDSTMLAASTGLCGRSTRELVRL